MTSSLIPSHAINIEKAFLTDIELAERWRMSPKTLRNLRVHGGHVPFVKIGRLVRYPREAILDYEREGLVAGSSNL